MSVCKKKMLPSLSRLHLHPNYRPDDDKIDNAEPVGAFFWRMTRGLSAATPALKTFKIYAAKVVQDKPTFLTNDGWIYVGLHLYSPKDILGTDPSEPSDKHYGELDENSRMSKVRFFLKPEAKDGEHAKLFVQTSIGGARSQYYWTVERAQWHDPTKWKCETQWTTHYDDLVKAHYEQRQVARHLRDALGVARAKVAEIPDQAIAREFFEMLPKPPLKRLTYEPTAFALDHDGEDVSTGGLLSMMSKRAAASTQAFGTFKLHATKPKKPPSHIPGDGWIHLEMKLDARVDLMPKANAEDPTQRKAMGYDQKNRYADRIHFYANPAKERLWVQTSKSDDANSLLLRSNFTYYVYKKGWKPTDSETSSHEWVFGLVATADSQSIVPYFAVVYDHYKDYNLILKLKAALEAAVDVQSAVTEKAAAAAFFDAIAISQS